MSVERNHTIVSAHHGDASAAFLADPGPGTAVLGRPRGRRPGEINHHDGGRGV